MSSLMNLLKISILAYSDSYPYVILDESVKIFCLFLNIRLLIFLLLSFESSYVICKRVFVKNSICKIFSPVSDLSSHFLMVFSYFYLFFFLSVFTELKFLIFLKPKSGEILLRSFFCLTYSLFSRFSSKSFIIIFHLDLWPIWVHFCTRCEMWIKISFWAPLISQLIYLWIFVKS